MSGFFTSAPPREPEPEHAQPKWVGPPENQLAESSRISFLPAYKVD